MTVVPKGCARCGGDLARVIEVGDTHYDCLQCGAIFDRLGPVPVRRVEEARAQAVSSEEVVRRRKLRRQLASRRRNGAA